MRRTFLLVLVLLAAAVPPATARVDTCDTLGIPTYRVEISTARKTYTFGEQAGLTLKVTHKITGQPVAGVFAAIGITTTRSDGFLFQFKKTNRRGRAAFEVPILRKHFQPGWVSVYGVAWRPVVDTVCASVTEYGEDRERRAFRVRD